MLHDHYTAFYGQTSKIPQLAPHPHSHREKKRSIMNQIPVCNTFVLFEPWQSTYLSLRDESGRLGLVVQPRCWPWVLGRNSCMVDRRGHCPHERPVTGRLWSILQQSYRFSPKPIWAMPSPPPPVPSSSPTLLILHNLFVSFFRGLGFCLSSWCCTSPPPFFLNSVCVCEWVCVSVCESVC